MKFSKILTSILAASLLASSLLCGCDSARNTRKTKGSSETEIVLPANEILVLNGYKNGAAGSVSSKIFILSDGRVYCSQEQLFGYRETYYKQFTDEQRVGILEKYTTPLTVIPEKDISKLYGYMLKINPDAEFEYDDKYCFDIGTDYTDVYVDGEAIRISESGEMTGRLEDRNAKRADSLINKKLKACGHIDYPSVYSGIEFYLDTLECPKDVVTVNSKRIITNLEDLKAFENETGLMLSKIDSFENFGNPDHDAFYDMCIAVQIFACPYMEEPDEAEAFVVSEEYTGFASLEEGNSADMTYEGKYKTWCHVVILPSYGTDGTSAYDAFLT